MSAFMEQVYGSRVAGLFTLLVLWTAFGSVFALLLGYSRVPYAAARDGYFFRSSRASIRPRGFPTCRSSCSARSRSSSCGFSLGTVIDALIATRIVVQFVGQIAGLVLLRRRRPDLPRPYRMWLYPVPAVVALVGWAFIFATTGPAVMLFGLAALAAGVVCFLAWSRRRRQWPFHDRGRR